MCGGRENYHSFTLAVILPRLNPRSPSRPNNPSHPPFDPLSLVTGPWCVVLLPIPASCISFVHFTWLTPRVDAHVFYRIGCIA